MSAFDRLLTVVEEQPLSRSLPVALRIASTTSDDEWASWIRLELMGYCADNPATSDDTVVPEYRSVPGQWFDDYGHALALEDPGLGSINELRLRHGVAELEGLAGSTGIVAMRPTEFTEIRGFSSLLGRTPSSRFSRRANTPRLRPASSPASFFAGLLAMPASFMVFALPGYF